MVRKFYYLLTGSLALVAAIAGYAFVTGTLPNIPAEARSAEMPANPHILFLAPEDTQRGTLTTESVQARGGEQVTSWAEAKAAARERPLDALIVDATVFADRSEQDTRWLVSQLDEGVVIVGIGISDDELASAIGIRTFQAPGEKQRQRGATDYRLVKAFVLAQPEDLKILRDSQWIDRAISGSTEFPNGIQSPLRSSFHKAQGEVQTPEGFALFFQRVEETIKGAYRVRAEYQNDLREKGVR